MSGWTFGAQSGSIGIKEVMEGAYLCARSRRVSQVL
jgi:hypothetical protein